MTQQVIVARVNARLVYDDEKTNPAHYGGKPEFVLSVLRDAEGDVAQGDPEDEEWVQVSFPGGTGREAIEIMEG